MNGKTSIYFDGAGLGQYSQYCMLNTNKASFIVMNMLGNKIKCLKIMLPRNAELIIITETFTKEI